MEIKDKAILKIDDISLSFGGQNVLVNVSLDTKEDEILAIIGPNGAGKTCLLNCISGYYQPQQGKIFFEDKEITRMPVDKRATLGIGRTFQMVELYTGMSVLENLMTARYLHIKSSLLAETLYFGPAVRHEREHIAVVEEIIDLLEIAHIRHKIVGTLPMGFRKRVELGRALALEPKVLLLDEPMAGMNLEEKEDMARFIIDIHEGKWTAVLKEQPTVILVEHDMGVVMDIADRVVVLDWGRLIADGTPDEIKVNPRVIKAYLGEEA